jgi:hypothetical protein
LPSDLYTLLVKLLPRLRGRRRARLTGVSTPLLGVSWEYGPSDREAVHDLFVYLETRRALWIPFNLEDHKHVVESILLMRDELTSIQRRLRYGSPASESVRRLRLTCERFLTDTPVQELYFYSNLGELRGIFGAELGRLASDFDIQVREPLVWIVPPIDENSVGRFVPIGEIPRTIYIKPPADFDATAAADPRVQQPEDSDEGSEGSDS